MNKYIYILYQDDNPNSWENESYEIGYYSSLEKAYKEKKKLLTQSYWEWYSKPKHYREYRLDLYVQFWIDKVELK